MITFADYLGIQHAQRSVKPRTHGLTMVMDQGVGSEFVKGMLEGFGQSLDIVKLWDPCLGSPLETVRKKVDIYRANDVIVQPGGIFLELARRQNDATIDEFEALLSAGAEKAYWEGHLLRTVMGDDPETIKARAGTGTQQVLEVVRASWQG